MSEQQTQVNNQTTSSPEKKAHRAPMKYHEINFERITSQSVDTKDISKVTGVDGTKQLVSKLGYQNDDGINEYLCFELDEVTSRGISVFTSKKDGSQVRSLYFPCLKIHPQIDKC